VWAADAGIEGDGGGDAPEAAKAAARAEHAAHDRHAVAWAAFRVADAHVALPAANIGELLRLPPLRKELLMHDGVIGLCEWRDRLVPVVDLAGALHALAPADAATWVCIVCEGELAIGLVVHEVLEIARIAPDAGTPEHAAETETERSVVQRRLVRGERTLQLLDVAALMRRYMETAISAKGARAAQLRTTSDPGAPAYMVFDAGGMFAAQIDGVQEVVALPEELRARLDAGSPATLQWREQPVPVVAIGDNLVALPAQAARQLVIVRRHERLAALAIVGVKAMVPRGVAQRSSIRMRGRPVEVISVDTEDHRASYPVVDLRVTQQA
jgi:chemotaxis signal transduction protein